MLLVQWDDRMWNVAGFVQVRMMCGICVAVPIELCSERFHLLWQIANVQENSE